MNKPRVIAPNGLPLCCFKADGTQLEHAHADHPTYQYPVWVELVGPLTDDHREDYRMMGGRTDPPSDEAVRAVFREWHALIYTDDCAALTLYECQYFLWRIKDGSAILAPRGIGLKEYRLTVPLKSPTEAPAESTRVDAALAELRAEMGLAIRRRD